ncbi:hypothetical protein IWQ60_012077 [Tieghemiomyces parasiticus]|uniref:Tetratricopeptide repeat protein 36 n=1 Tax=Tieghemiomyces parasiticus TaxID=78921 RepID=A0A9W7ZMB2_9FUNG|nr:hypothetical protein IWQ60_012077 [Tieghemiomyces parasiticus]
MSLSNRDTNVLDVIFGGETFEKLSPLPEEKRQDLREREREGIKLAEADKLTEAAAIFTALLAEEETYASAYNNRAQVHRLQDQYELALADLANALKYSRQDPEVLKQAYTQRAIIRKAQGDADGALRDFELGGQYGNAVAKEIAVKENPYAKLCNAMMKESMKQLYP